MTSEHVEFCSIRFRAFSKTIFSGQVVVEIVGPPKVYENGGLQQSVPPTMYDKTAKYLGTFLVTGPIIPPLPTTSLSGGISSLDSYLKSLEQYGCKVEKEA